MSARTLLVCAALLMVACAPAPEQRPAPQSATAAPAAALTWAELSKRPRPEPTTVLRFGDHPAQFAELWLPTGSGPYPAVVLIHGGCWTKEQADHGYFRYAADDLRGRGLAVLNIEYRGVDERGGGYPGTFQDVAAALDLLRREAPGRGIDLSRLVVAGHSAGGHLATWAAARARVAAESPLHASAPLPVAAVVNIAGIPDLERERETACGAEPMTAMAGPSGDGRPDVFADTSPAHMLPLGVPQLLVYGAQDRIVPPAVGERYALRARAAGDRIAVRTTPGGHFDVVAPGGRDWAVIGDEIERLARRGWDAPR